MGGFWGMLCGRIFLVPVSKATPDKATASLAPLGSEVLWTSLTESTETELKQALDAQKAEQAQA